MIDAKKQKQMNRNTAWTKSYPLHLMILVPAFLLVLFHGGSLLGLFTAFEDYIPGKGWFVFGSEFVGFDNFKRIFDNPDIWNVIGNTIIISLLKIIFGTIFPIIVAILLNEVHLKLFKKSVQTIIFIPYFISWVILGGIFSRLLSPDGGTLPSILNSIGIKCPNFIGDPAWFRTYVVITAIWKGAGYTTIIHLASITTINPSLYEAASMDGANKVQQCFKVTIPGMMPSILLMFVLNMGTILSAGFDQIYVLYSIPVYKTGDILDTFIYRIAMEGATDYGLSTAVGLLKSIISFAFVLISYKIADKKFGYKVL